MNTEVLAGQLTAEHGHVVPASLIRTTVEMVSGGPLAADPVDAERVLRADVAELAAAFRRSGR